MLKEIKVHFKRHRNTSIQIYMFYCTIDDFFKTYIGKKNFTFKKNEIMKQNSREQVDM